MGFDLDFFIMTTSFVTLVGSVTQATYSTATLFQNDFSQWRLSRGLHSQAYALGLILEIGTAVSQPEVQRTINRNDIYGTTEAELLKLIEAAFLP